MKKTNRTDRPKLSLTKQTVVRLHTGLKAGRPPPQNPFTSVVGCPASCFVPCE